MNSPIALSYRYHMREAYHIAHGSPDPSTQNGAIVLNDRGTVIAVGYNDFTAGMPVTKDLLERPKKYTYIEHAERNALYAATRRGHIPHTMVCPWASCHDCARAIVQTGVKRLVRHIRDLGTADTRWGGSIEDGDIMLRAGGVEIVEIEGPLGGCDPILFNGERWTP